MFGRRPLWGIGGVSGGEGGREKSKNGVGEVVGE